MVGKLDHHTILFKNNYQYNLQPINPVRFPTSTSWGTSPYSSSKLFKNYLSINLASFSSCFKASSSWLSILPSLSLLFFFFLCLCSLLTLDCSGSSYYYCEGLSGLSLLLSLLEERLSCIYK